MAYRVFDLSYVPRDEENALRKYLIEKGIKYYETPSGPHSAPAVWVSSAKEAERAKIVIEEFQSSWLKKAREGIRERSSTERRISIKAILLIIVIFIVLFLASVRGS